MKTQYTPVPIMRSISLAIAVILGALIAPPAMADDLFPPSWRQQPGTTFQAWEFYTDYPMAAPDVIDNPYGFANATVYPGVGQSWMPEYEGGIGVWPLSGDMYLSVSNSPVANPYKDIYLQLTWAPQAPGNAPFVMTVVPNMVNATLIQQLPLGGPWIHSIYSIRLEPNPSYEVILVTGGINVDEVVVDTICVVPEPGIGSLALLGIIALLRPLRHSRH